MLAADDPERLRPGAEAQHVEVATLDGRAEPLQPCRAARLRTGHQVLVAPQRVRREIREPGDVGVGGMEDGEHGSATGRERGWQYGVCSGVGVYLNKKKNHIKREK